MNGNGPSSSRRVTGGLSRQQFLTVVCLFWAYVTLSNVLYAFGMRTGTAHITDVPLFASWDARVIQHVLLLPLVLISFWASLRIQWRPVWLAVPLQLVLGAVFATLAYPAMTLAEFILGSADWTLGTGQWAGKMIEHSSDPMADRYFLSLWLASIVNFLPAYGFGLALVTGLVLYTRYRDSELQLAALEREWSTARLAALRMQLSPHTLFNLLHTIRGNIGWDPQGAQSMVVQLADLLRRLLSAGEQDFTRLMDELQFVRMYLELQQRRFSDRLSIELPESHEIYALWVPSLILQPLVENAVVHGLAGHQGPVIVKVTAQATQEALLLRVTNTLARGKVRGEAGIGLKNVSERLAVQFEGRAGLLAGPEGDLWVSEIRLPQIHDSPERRGARTRGRTDPVNA